MQTFKIVSGRTASGPRLFVAVDHYSAFPDILGSADKNIIITADAADQQEFDGLVDELITELQQLKATAALQFKVQGQ